MRSLALPIALLLFGLAAPAGAQEEEGLTPAVIEAFGKRVEETMASGDSSFFDARMDIDAFIDHIVQDVDAPGQFEAGFRSGIRSKQFLGPQIVQNLQDYAGTYTFLRALPGTPPRALFRLDSDQGLNYHELYLAWDPALGGVVYNDLYVYISGERTSETLRRVYLAGLAQENRGVLDKLMGKEVAYIQSLPRIRQITALIRQGQYPRALTLYGTLPEEVQNQNEVLLLRIQAAANVGEEEYTAAAKAFEKAFPDSPALDLICLDRYLFAGDYARCFELLDRLDGRVQDPYLDILRGNVHASAGTYDKAQTFAKKAMERDPRLAYQATFSLLSTALTAKDHPETARLLTQLERDFGVEWNALTDYEEYADFVASPEYRAWLKRNQTPGE